MYKRQLLGCPNGYDAKGKFILQHPERGVIPTFKEHGIPCVSSVIANALIDELEEAMYQKNEMKCLRIMNLAGTSTDEDLDSTLVQLREDDPEVFNMVQMKLFQMVQEAYVETMEEGQSGQDQGRDMGNTRISDIREGPDQGFQMTQEQLEMFLLSKCTKCGWRGVP